MRSKCARPSCAFPFSSVPKAAGFGFSERSTTEKDGRGQPETSKTIITINMGASKQQHQECIEHLAKLSKLVEEYTQTVAEWKEKWDRVLRQEPQVINDSPRTAANTVIAELKRRGILNACGDVIPPEGQRIEIEITRLPTP